MIFESLLVGQRSEAIFSVIDSLISAGLSDSEIHIIFDQNPIGDKMREKGGIGPQWLQMQIDKARKTVSPRTDGPQQRRYRHRRELPESDGPESEKETTFLSAPEPFPVEILPPYFAESIRQAARAFAVPIIIPAVTFIVIAGACIGRLYRLLVKPGWTEHANLFVSIVARSGFGKSPVVRTFMKAIFRAEKKSFDEYQAELAVYQGEMEARRGQRSADLGPAPEKPYWIQTYVDDATEEALTDALVNNPKGILWYNDELSGLLLNLARYRSDGKADGPKARLMSAYDCGPWKRTRKSGDNAFIQNACMSIFGTIQPAMIPQIFSNSDALSGFLPRFLLVYGSPDSPPFWTDETFDGELQDRIDNFIGDLLKMKMGEKPSIICMSSQAKSIFRQWFNEQAAEPWRDFDSQQYEAISAKLRGQCARLALILHVIDCYVSGCDIAKESIHADTMQRAVILANWFKSHQRVVWQTIGKAGQVTECSPLEKRIAVAIIDLEAEITGGMLANSKVTGQVNFGVDDNFRVSAVSIGKCYKKLGLYSKQMPDKTMGRGVVITEADIKRLKKYVGSVGSVGNAETAQQSDADRSFSSVGSVGKKDDDSQSAADRSNRSFSSVGSEEARKNWAADRSDKSDRYFNKVIPENGCQDEINDEVIL